MKTLVLGLGNPLIGDDSVGLRVVAELKSRLAERTDWELSEDYWGGLRLMERMIGFERAIVVDAIQTGAPAGHDPPADARRHSDAADRLGPRCESFDRVGVRPQGRRKLPENRDILLIGIEAQDVLTFSEQCTPAVQAAVPRAVEVVLEALGVRS